MSIRSSSPFTPSVPRGLLPAGHFTWAAASGTPGWAGIEIFRDLPFFRRFFTIFTNCLRLSVVLFIWFPNEHMFAGTKTGLIKTKVVIDWALLHPLASISATGCPNIKRIFLVRIVAACLPSVPDPIGIVSHWFNTIYLLPVIRVKFTW